MKKIIASLWFIIFTGFAWASPLYAQNSIIIAAQEAMQSMVGLRAIRTSNDPAHPLTALNIKKEKIPTLEQYGAGVIISADGYIITNFHIVYLADTIKIKLPNGSVVSGTIKHLLPNEDLALIKIKPTKPLKPISFANSDTIQLGEDIINIGHSDYLKRTISGGKIISLGKSAIDASAIELIRVNIDLHKGDSGGPLLNNEGKLIGMVAAEFTDSPQSTLAIPSNKIKKLYQDFIK